MGPSPRPVGSAAGTPESVRTELNYKTPKGFPDGSADKEPACNAGNRGDMGSIPGSGGFPGGGHGNRSSILVWEVLWMEEPGLQSTGSQRVRHD